MNILRRIVACRLAATVAIFPTAAFSAEAGSAAPTGEITPEIRMEMLAGAQRYGACLRDEAQKVMAQHEDVRQVADVAMGACRGLLQDMERTLAAKNVDPDFVANFVRHTRDSSARRLLPGLMSQRAAETGAAP